jgi:hypothetical protein
VVNMDTTLVTYFHGTTLAIMDPSESRQLDWAGLQSNE